MSIRNQGTGAGQIGFAGGTVSFGGVAIGTVSGGAGGNLTVAFNGMANSGGDRGADREPDLCQCVRHTDAEPDLDGRSDRRRRHGRRGADRRHGSEPRAGGHRQQRDDRRRHRLYLHGRRFRLQRCARQQWARRRQGHDAAGRRHAAQQRRCRDRRAVASPSPTSLPASSPSGPRSTPMAPPMRNSASRCRTMAASPMAASISTRRRTR